MLADNALQPLGEFGRTESIEVIHAPDVLADLLAEAYIDDRLDGIGEVTIRVRLTRVRLDGAHELAQPV